MTDRPILIGCDAELGLTGWGGVTWQRVRVIGETPKRWRIQALTDRTKLGGRMRFINAGDTALVPKRALRPVTP